MATHSGAHPPARERRHRLGASHRRRIRPHRRGGDFAFHLGQDVSIGYSSHTDATVRLYLQETFTFLVLTTEAAVALSPA